MYPHSLMERELARALSGASSTRPDPARSLVELHELLDRLERREHWREFLRVVKSCASHLVIEGDEDA